MTPYRRIRGLLSYQVPGYDFDYSANKNWPDNDEARARLLAHAEQCDAENKLRYEAYTAIYEEFAKAFAVMEDTFEHGSTKKKTKRAKMLADMKPPYPYREAERVKDSVRVHRENKEYAERHTKAEQKAKDRDALVTQAVSFVLAHGYKLTNAATGKFEREGHKTFTGRSVVDIADELRHDELVAEARQQMDGPIRFDGATCEKPCAGWDGESHRCECGHRRVSWTSDGNFLDMRVYAAAH